MKTIVIAAALLLASCGLTPQGDAIRDVIKEKGAQAAEEGLKNSAWAVCHAVTHGAVERLYQQGTDKRKAYDTFCGFGKNIEP